jgi:hypothetical protein
MSETTVEESDPFRKQEIENLQSTAVADEKIDLPESLEDL